jgi:hypothetical protein
MEKRLNVIIMYNLPFRIQIILKITLFVAWISYMFAIKLLAPTSNCHQTPPLNIHEVGRTVLNLIWWYIVCSRLLDLGLELVSCSLIPLEWFVAPLLYKNITIADVASGTTMWWWDFSWFEGQHLIFVIHYRQISQTFVFYWGYGRVPQVNVIVLITAAMWILRYPAHRYRAMPSLGFDPKTLWLRVRHPMTIQKFGGNAL